MVLKILDHDICRDRTECSQQLAEQFLRSSETADVSMLINRVGTTYSVGREGVLASDRAVDPTSSRYSANLTSDLEQSGLACRERPKPIALVRPMSSSSELQADRA
jgi:hypothetical protein